MRGASLQKTRFLTLDEISDLWYKQLLISRGVVLRELRIGVINLRRVSDGLPWVKELPKETELPPSSHVVDKAWMSNFCNKQGWPYPLFWFPSEDPNPRRRGRPAYPHMKAIREELARRAEQSELATTLTEETRHLQRWASQQFPSPDAPKLKTLSNELRGDYNAHKRHSK